MSQEVRESSTAREVRSRVLRSQDRVWGIEEFDGSADAVQSELRRLVKAGELEHLRRGVYWRGHRTRFGMTVASQGQALRKVLGGHVAIGATGWHASNLLGLSTQIPPVEMLAITARPPTGFAHLKLVDRSRRVERREQRLNDLEVTVLEALEGWDRFVEEPSELAKARFRDLMMRDDVRVGKLVAAARSEPAVVRERLRQVLVEGGWSGEAARVPRARSRSAKERALAVFRSVEPGPTA